MNIEQDNYIYFNPGDLVEVKHDIANKPKMLVLEKVTRCITNKDGDRSTMFCGIKCTWFDKNQDLQTAIFSTKDLKHI